MVRVLHDDKECGRIIGTGGGRIKEIRAVSNASVQLTKGTSLYPGTKCACARLRRGRGAAAGAAARARSGRALAAWLADTDSRRAAVRVPAAVRVMKIMGDMSSVLSAVHLVLSSNSPTA